MLVKEKLRKLNVVDYVILDEDFCQQYTVLLRFGF